jgi:hypothetical protein
VQIAPADPVAATSIRISSERPSRRLNGATLASHDPCKRTALFIDLKLRFGRFPHLPTEPKGLISDPLLSFEIDPVNCQRGEAGEPSESFRVSFRMAFAYSWATPREVFSR